VTLNPILYERLRKEFIHVVVANEGEAMLKSYGEDPLTGRRRISVTPGCAGEYYRVNCPYCGDTRKRLWVNHMFGVVDDETGSRCLWLAVCYNEGCMSVEGRPWELYERLYGFRNLNVRSADVLPGRVNDPAELTEIEFAGVTVPLKDLPLGAPAVVYVNSRGFDHRELSDMYGISLCVSAPEDCPMAQGRLFIPIRMRGVQVGWQCRYVGDLDWKLTDTPKYYGARHMAKRAMLYNFDVARASGCAIVCEGASDVWSVGRRGVALMGKSMSDLQAQLICSTWPGGAVLVALDGDAFDEAQCIVDRLSSSYDGMVGLITFPPDIDPGDLDRTVLGAHISACAAAQGIALDKYAGQTANDTS